MDSKGFITVNKVRIITSRHFRSPFFKAAVYNIGYSQMMQTNVEGVFAGGDVVTFPLALRGNKKVNIPHWQTAHVHGKHQVQKASLFLHICIHWTD